MRLFVSALLASVVLQPGALAQSAPQTGAAPTPVATSADRRIAELRQQLAADPKHTEAYADLALAEIRRARDTGDPASLAEADKALGAGQRLAPKDFQLAKAQVALLLARQQWKQALAQARSLNTGTPDDVTVYGYIAEADLALGDEADAEKSVQWMINMRPNNLAALLLGAELRVRFHDEAGALDFLTTAYAETPPIEPEEQAWIADKIAEIQINTGHLPSAEKTLAQAEEFFPHSPTTGALRARLQVAEQRAPSSANAATAAMSVAGTTPAASPAQPSAQITLQQDKGGVPTALLIPRATNTDRAIKKVQGLVAARPADPKAYAQLGAAFSQRARETGDVEDFNLAEQALTKSLSLQSADLPAAEPLATMAEVCMGEHRFADALSYAQRSLALGSGDLSPFAIVGDAYADMGEYEKAGIAYARLAPAGGHAGSQPGYAQQSRAAYLDFVSGDTAAAVGGMQTAIANALEVRLPAENLAWLYYELGEFSYQAGQIQPAADAYYTALTVYPGNYRALAGLGKVRAAQGRLADAITLYQAAIAVVPMPLYVAELGDIYVKNGQPGEAEKQYKLVEYIGRLGHINQVLHNRDLALFYADHDRNLPEAVALAHKEFEVRSDIYTWDALAWALYKNGKYPEASDAMKHALRLGTNDALLLFHAGMISAKLGQQADATRQLAQAITLNPHFHVVYAEQAVQQLSALRKEAVVASNASSIAQKTSATSR